VAGRAVRIIGVPDFTVDDVRDLLTEPGFDPATDAWLVVTPQDRLAGFGWASGRDKGDLVDVDVVADDERVAEWLFAQVLARARELGAARGVDEVRVDIGIYRADEAQQARARALGFAPATTFHRMRIDHDSPPADPAVPDGVTFRVGPGDDALRRDGHAVLTASFADHFGFTPEPFDAWHERVSHSASHDWSQLRVAYVEDAPVAMLLGSNAFVADEGCGYVSNVGVLTSARGRGLAKLLLRSAFAEDARRGRTGTILHVDTNNLTPALDLYLGVGMRVVLVVDVWRRVTTTGGDAASRP
jgi:ribosomal protein S18 acetylase RimI-like enzyme